MQWFIKCFKNYASFDGRARRKEYWMFHLFNVIFVFAIYFLLLLFLAISKNLVFIPIILLFIYVIALFIPSISVTVRRLHDIGKSGAYYFISFIPYIGGIWLLILNCTEGQRCDNIYGPDPKAVYLSENYISE